MNFREIVHRVRLAGLLSAVRGEADVEVRGVTDDSRTVQPGDLYCAWAGTARDAHEFAPAAVSAGAAALLVERPLPDVAVPQIVVTDGRRASAVAAMAVFGDPQHALTTVGVTGTNGKTTTVWMLRHLLGTTQPAGSIGTLGALLPDGSVLPGSEALTTPGPVQLARTLRALRDAGADALAMEVSSHALHQGRVASLRFDAAVFTNLTRDHLDYHGTIENYRDAKRSFTTLLTADGVAVINADDPAWFGLAASAPRALTFGAGSDVDVRFHDVVVDSAGAAFTLTTPQGAASVRIPLLGDFNVQNAVGAAAACLALGHGLADVVAGLATIPQVPGRLERIARTPCPVLRDYAHTPDALERVLAALRPLANGRLIAVFGAGGDRDRGKRPLMGAVAATGADVAIVTSDNPRTEDPDTIIDEIVAGMTDGHAIRIADRRAAIAHALEIAAPADIVLLAGKGHEDYQILGTEKISFDERVIVHELLSARAGEVRG